MKGYWLEGEALAQVWSQLPVGREPFSAYEVWQAMGEPWGAFVLEETGRPLAAWPFGLRSLGWFRLYRQPLILPWVPVRLAEPLANSSAARLRQIAHLLGGLAQAVRRQPRSYIAGALGPLWSYLPPLVQHNLRVRGAGSLVLQVGQFVPTAELRRKVRQVSCLPFQAIAPTEAYAFWVQHRPKGVSAKAAALLGRLVSLSFWRAWVIGEPPQAVGLFLEAPDRLWYIAGARSPQAHAQAMTRLLYEVIQLSQREEKTFDFCGSTLPTIERFFRQYGPVWEPRYFFSAWRLW